MGAVLSEQFAYGHREEVLWAAGLPFNAILWGILPHAGIGRPEELGFELQRRKDPIGREIPQWFWNESWVTEAQARGVKRAYALGSPWLYHLRRKGILPAWESGRPAMQGTPGYLLFVPRHTWEGHVYPARVPARELEVLAQGRDICVLLAWPDFLCRDTRSRYEEAGMQVHCAGFRASPYFLPWSAAGDRTCFLENLRQTFAGASQVVSESPGAALVYAASLGVPIQIVPELSTVPADQDLRAYTDAIARLSSTLRWAYSENNDLRKHVDQIAEMLGADSVRSQEQLLGVLQWKVLSKELPADWPTGWEKRRQAVGSPGMSEST